MMNLALPAFGIVLFATCLIRFLLKRTVVTTLNVNAAALCLLAFCLWPDAYGLAFDRWIHGIGVAHIISRVAITAGATLHIIAVAYGINRWDRRRQALLLVPVCVFTGLYVFFWGQAHQSHIANVETLFYHGYHGRPTTVFLMSAARGLTIMWYSAIAVYIYAKVALGDYRARRWRELCTPVSVMGLIFVGSFVIGVIDIVEAAADHAGRTGQIISALPEISFVGLIACIATFVVVYIVNLIARPVWQTGRDVRHAPERLTEIRQATAELARQTDNLERARADVRDLNNRIDSKLIPITYYADPNIERAMKEECATEQLSDEDCELGLAAARAITLRPDHIDRLLKRGEQQLDPAALTLDQDPTTGARHFAKLSERDLYFYADADLVVALALGAERYGVPLRREPQARHRRVARLLAKVLAAYDQPYSYVDAYHEEMTRRIDEKQQMLADLGLDAPNDKRGNKNGADKVGGDGAALESSPSVPLILPRRSRR